MPDKAESKKNYIIKGSDLKYNGKHYKEEKKITLTDAEAKMLSKQITLAEVKNG